MEKIPQNFDFKLLLSKIDFILTENKDGLKKLQEKVFKIGVEDNFLIIDDKKFKVIEDFECKYTYKIQKTQIKAIDGINGLLKELYKASKDDLFNGYFFKMLYFVCNNCKSY